MLVLLAGFAVLRALSAARAPGIYPDSATYGHLDFLGGQERLWAVPLIYTVLPANGAREAFQILLGIVAWSALALSVRSSFSDRRVGLASMVAVLALGLLPQVTVWGADMLSESISLSLVVLLVALLLRLARGASRRTLAATLLVAVGWVFTKQENVVIYLALAPLIVGFAAWRLPRRTAAWVCLAVVLIGAWGAGEVMSQTKPPANSVWVDNAADILLSRLSSQPAAMSYFAHHGMPVVLVREATRMRAGADWLVNQPRFLDWDQTRFKRTYEGYLLSEMPEPLLKPFQGLITNALGSPAFGDPRPIVPGMVWGLALLLGVVVLDGLLIACVLRRRRFRIGWVPVLLLAFVAVTTVIDYDFGGYDLQRLFVSGAVCLRLALILAIASAADGLLSPRSRKPVEARPTVERFQTPKSGRSSRTPVPAG